MIYQWWLPLIVVLLDDDLTECDPRFGPAFVVVGGAVYLLGWTYRHTHPYTQ